MPDRTFDWLNRFKDVEREFLAISFSTKHVLEQLGRGEVVLSGEMKTGQILNAFERLELTYYLHMFGEFERGLRTFLRANGAIVRTKAVHLIHDVADIARIGRETKRQANLVRDYRNKIAHKVEKELKPITLADARRAICNFFGCLHGKWPY